MQADAAKKREEFDRVLAAGRSEPTLVDRYVAKFGKKPHHKMKPETIRERLAQ